MLTGTNLIFYVLLKRDRIDFKLSFFTKINVSEWLWEMQMSLGWSIDLINTHAKVTRYTNMS